MIIGIAGQKYSGKDTIADIFCHYWGFQKKSLAQPIKDALNIIFDWSESDWQAENKEQIDLRWGVSPRQMAQDLGTDWGQFGLMERFNNFQLEVGRNLWVFRLLLQIRDTDNVVIPDVRYLHECEAIWSQGGVVIRVFRDLNNSDNHISENSLKDINPDYVIDNFHGIMELERQVMSIADVLGFPIPTDFQTYDNV